MYLVLGDDPFEGYSTAQRVVIVVSFVLVACLLAAKATMFVDERRSLLDRAFGLVYLEELVFTRVEQGPGRGPGACGSGTRRADLCVGEVAPLSRSEVVHREAGVLATVQPPNRVADRLAHPLHLMLAALVEGELES